MANAAEAALLRKGFTEGLTPMRAGWVPFFVSEEVAYSLNGLPESPAKLEASATLILLATPAKSPKIGSWNPF
jgi:hypothetical protein